MARPAPTLALGDRLARDLTSASSMDDVADRVYAAIRRHVDFDFACFATTDPTTGVLTWASKTRDLGVGDVDFAAAEYGAPDINKFDEIARRDPPVAILSIDTDSAVGPRPGRRSGSTVGRRILPSTPPTRR